ncbi:hypothetical protein JAAARDRAFT_217301 [Jaapia argillacea MUCL 33604]|uniref:Uncharacterized protein n=1 Tax=Jaapia argillacea MUCL 33604 TaxID=933084 RepID=A0A067QD79_9AGAM|nr:hypothetical protein JAAARDRAFT_217301 [Jaapia argillacea MUCL 33604]
MQSIFNRNPGQQYMSSLQQQQMSNVSQPASAPPIVSASPFASNTAFTQQHGGPYYQYSAQHQSYYGQTLQTPVATFQNYQGGSTTIPAASARAQTSSHVPPQTKVPPAASSNTTPASHPRNANVSHVNPTVTSTQASIASATQPQSQPIVANSSKTTPSTSADPNSSTPAMPRPSSSAPGATQADNDSSTASRPTTVPHPTQTGSSSQPDSQRAEIHRMSAAALKAHVSKMDPEQHRAFVQHLRRIAGDSGPSVPSDSSARVPVWPALTPQSHPNPEAPQPAPPPRLPTNPTAPPANIIAIPPAPSAGGRNQKTSAPDPAPRAGSLQINASQQGAYNSNAGANNRQAVPPGSGPIPYGSAPSAQRPAHWNVAPLQYPHSSSGAQPHHHTPSSVSYPSSSPSPFVYYVPSPLPPAASSTQLPHPNAHAPPASTPASKTSSLPHGQTVMTIPLVPWNPPNGPSRVPTTPAKADRARLARDILRSLQKGSIPAPRTAASSVRVEDLRPPAPSAIPQNEVPEPLITAKAHNATSADEPAKLHEIIDVDKDQPMDIDSDIATSKTTLSLDATLDIPKPTESSPAITQLVDDTNIGKRKLGDLETAVELIKEDLIKKKQRLEHETNDIHIYEYFDLVNDADAPDANVESHEALTQEDEEESHGAEVGLDGVNIDEHFDLAGEPDVIAVAEEEVEVLVEGVEEDELVDPDATEDELEQDIGRDKTVLVHPHVDEEDELVDVPPDVEPPPPSPLQVTPPRSASPTPDLVPLPLSSAQPDPGTSIVEIASPLPTSPKSKRSSLVAAATPVKQPLFLPSPTSSPSQGDALEDGVPAQEDGRWNVVDKSSSPPIPLPKMNPRKKRPKVEVYVLVPPVPEWLKRARESEKAKKWKKPHLIGPEDHGKSSIRQKPSRPDSLPIVIISSDDDDDEANKSKGARVEEQAEQSRQKGCGARRRR